VEWERTGRALYMADFLEPGRKFDVGARAACAAAVPRDFEGSFRSVVRMRIEWTLREEKLLHEETARLWNAVR
jgi:2-amino-4-hydroxy-6-hydroxymethyldihydropteridine diphosphokinase